MEKLPGEWPGTRWSLGISILVQQVEWSLELEQDYHRSGEDGLGVRIVQHNPKAVGEVGQAVPCKGNNSSNAGNLES